MPSTFQSTHPVWGATELTDLRDTFIQFQSTHPVWGATNNPPPRQTAHIFQSTHPVWGATTRQPLPRRSQHDFNPRTPCGVRRVIEVFPPPCTVFQSTHPVWGATQGSCCSYEPGFISIHAPRVGCDADLKSIHGLRTYFNPRTPCGVRLRPTEQIYLTSNAISIHAPRVGCDSLTGASNGAHPLFQSTHPVWGATSLTGASNGAHPLFQSTHPVWGATGQQSRYILASRYFNPRTPCGVRRGSATAAQEIAEISIHAPRVGCDRGAADMAESLQQFQSTHPVWGATKSQRK